MSLWLPATDEDFDDFFAAAGLVDHCELADLRTSPLAPSPKGLVPSLSTSSSYLQSPAEDETGWDSSPAMALGTAAVPQAKARRARNSHPPVVYPALSEAALREPVRLPSSQADLTLGKYTSQARQERLDRWRAKRVWLLQRASEARTVSYTQRQHIVRLVPALSAAHPRAPQARSKPRAGGRFVKSALGNKKNKSKKT